MAISGRCVRWATLTGFLIFLLFSGRPQEALASYYEVTASGSWSSFSSNSSTLYDDNGLWSFSFDLPASLNLSSTTSSFQTSSVSSSYQGLTTYQAENFQFNNNSPGSIELVNEAGSFTSSTGAFGGGTFNYSGGITFGTSSTNSGRNGLLFETCLSGCQTAPTQFGPDGFIVTLGSNLPANGILLTSSTDTTGNSLNLFSGNIDLNFDNSLGTGSGTMTIESLPGQIPGTGQGTLAATPEPASWLLFGTGMLLMGGVAVRRRERLNRI